MTIDAVHLGGKGHFLNQVALGRDLEGEMWSVEFRLSRRKQQGTGGWIEMVTPQTEINRYY